MQADEIEGKENSFSENIKNIVPRGKFTRSPVASILPENMEGQARGGQ